MEIFLGGDFLETYRIRLDPVCSRLYEKVAADAGLPVEQVLADALYRLAATLSLEALAKKHERI